MLNIHNGADIGGIFLYEMTHACINNIIYICNNRSNNIIIYENSIHSYKTFNSQHESAWQIPIAISKIWFLSYITEVKQRVIHRNGARG